MIRSKKQAKAAFFSFNRFRLQNMGLKNTRLSIAVLRKYDEKGNLLYLGKEELGVSLSQLLLIGKAKGNSQILEL